MICQQCRSAEATIHETGRLPSGRFIERHYCPRCAADHEIELRYCRRNAADRDRGPVDRPGATRPRPTFTIRRLMILVAIFSVPNFVVAWIARNRPAPWTAEQRDQWTFRAMLTVNACLAMVVAYRILAGWLRDLIRADEAREARPRPRDVPGVWTIPVFYVFWVMNSSALTAWLTTALFPDRVFSVLLFIPVAILTAALSVVLGWSWSESRALVIYARDRWAFASRPGRVGMVADMSWLPMIIVFVQPNLRRLIAIINPWFLLPTSLLVVLGYRILFLAAEALLTRRRVGRRPRGKSR